VDLRAARSGACGQLVGKAALADPGLAGHQEQAPAAREGVIETAYELGEFALAAHKRAARTLRSRLGHLRLLHRELESRILREYRPLELA